MSYKILTLNNISVRGLERLPRDRYEVASEIGHPDAILLRSADMHAMEIPSSVLAVAPRRRRHQQRAGRQAEPSRGAGVQRAGRQCQRGEELVLAGLFLSARNICQAWGFVRSLEGDDHAVEEAVEKGKKNFVGHELPSRTLGVVGLGAIGVEVANAALALGMKVLGYDPQITVQRAWQLSSGVEQALSLDDLFARSDIVTVHVPLNDATRGLVNPLRFDLMRRGSRCSNFSRAQIVDEAAVLAALEPRQVPTYVCDFPSRAVKDTRASSCCRIWAPRPARPRTTARSWSRTRSATIWKTATSATRSISPRWSCLGGENIVAMSNAGAEHGEPDLHAPWGGQAEHR